MEATEDDRREGSSEVEIEIGRLQNILEVFYEGTGRDGAPTGWLGLYWGLDGFITGYYD